MFDVNYVVKYYKFGSFAYVDAYVEMITPMNRLLIETVIYRYPDRLVSYIWTASLIRLYWSRRGGSK
jgi:hypothetical protein